MVEAEIPGADFLAKLKKQHHKTLITILVLNNFVNVAISSLITVIATEYFKSSGLGIAMGIATFLVLIFGEIAPKSLASNFAKSLGPRIAMPLYVIATILTPLIFLLDLLVNGVQRLMGVKHHIEVTDEELIAMASIGAEEGTIDKDELEFIENALEFNDIKVDSLATPRVHVDALPEEYSLKEASEFVVHHTHTRIPIYRDTIDNIVGILQTKELLRALHEGENPEELTLRQLKLLSPLKVPQGMTVHDLFLEFKKKRMHMAVVLDEHGGTAGIITMEDLLEELVGDIEDEQDVVEEHIKKLGENLYELDGRTELDEITELTEIKFKHPEYKTVSFIIVDSLGYLPRKNQGVIIGGWEFKVTKMLRNTIIKVEIKKLVEQKKL